MPDQLQELGVVRVNGIMRGLQDTRLIPGDLKFLGRTPIVPASDQEILGRFLGHIQIADVIQDDAEAAVYSAGRMSFETYKIPNLKHGVNLTQEQLNQLLWLQQSGAAGVPGADLIGIGPDFEKNIIDGLLLGIRQRMEALIIAAYTDTFVYDRLGIKITGTFGMPADLKVTPSIPWTSVLATPVDDLLSVKLVGTTRYGITFDRVEMSTAALRAMVATTEFQNKARMYLAPNVSFVNISQFSLDELQRLATTVIGMSIETYDGRYWSQNTNGTWSNFPFLSIGTVVLSSRANDNGTAFDFANGITTESLVSALAPTNMIGRFNGPTRGPIAYATAPADLNPPNLTYWGVARGMARRKLLQGSATLSVGNLTDPIPVSEPPII